MEFLNVSGFVGFYLCVCVLWIVAIPPKSLLTDGYINPSEVTQMQYTYLYAYVHTSTQSKRCGKSSCPVTAGQAYADAIYLQEKQSPSPFLSVSYTAVPFRFTSKAAVQLEFILESFSCLCRTR